MTNTPRTAGKSTYIALLRGINVGGHKIVTMDQLRTVLQGLGFKDVQTYVQSGNVVFKAPAQAAETLCKRIEDEILTRFRLSVPVIVRTSAEIGEVLENNRFLREKGIDSSTLHVTFLSRVPDRAALRMLDAIAAGPDRFLCSGQEIYLCCPTGFAGTKLSISTFEKLLSVRATTRNWNTVTRLHQMSLA